MKMALPIRSYYYRRLFLYVLLVSMIAVLVLSVMFYARVKQELAEQFLKDNLSILQKSAYSIESVHDTVSTLMATLGKNTDIQRIMYGHEPEDELVFRTIINLKNNVLSHYAFIKHLYIYNDRNGKVYSTRGNFTVIPEDLAPFVTGENPAQYLRPYFHILPYNCEAIIDLSWCFPRSIKGLPCNCEAFIGLSWCFPRSIKGLSFHHQHAGTAWNHFFSQLHPSSCIH